MKQISVLLIEDHFLARMALHSVLSGHPQIRIIGEAGDGELGVTMYRTLRPDVVVLDLRLPRLSGAMKMWINDARYHLDWREHAVPRVITTSIKKRDGTPLTFTVDDSLADVQTKPSPEFKAWERWLETGELDE